MSGGRFNYADLQLQSEVFGYTDKPKNVFEDREISELVFDMLNLIHTFDLYESGDTGEENYLKDKSEFKKKWFGDNSKRQKRIVDEAVNELKEELYKTFDLKNEEGSG